MKGIFLALVASAAAPAQQQFDLICASHGHDATFHYRVDLAASAYCVTQDEGKQLTDIGSDCPSHAVLAATSDAILFSQIPIQLVRRDTGEWTFKSGQSVLYRGTCERADFSGFPNFATKF
jgi:hypothetical protein